MGTEQFLKVEKRIDLKQVVINMNKYEKKSFLRQMFDLTGAIFDENGLSKEKVLFPEDFFDRVLK